MLDLTIHDVAFRNIPRQCSEHHGPSFLQAELLVDLHVVFIALRTPRVRGLWVFTAGLRLSVPTRPASRTHQSDLSRTCGLTTSLGRVRLRESAANAAPQAALAGEVPKLYNVSPYRSRTSVSPPLSMVWMRYTDLRDLYTR